MILLKGIGVASRSVSETLHMLWQLMTNEHSALAVILSQARFAFLTFLCLKISNPHSSGFGRTKQLRKVTSGGTGR